MSRRRSAHATIVYQPALDGLRAVAVVMVLCFHAGFRWMEGGYFGVSVFFTLSGFLVTSVLLANERSDGTVSLGRFYARRARRLLPASLVCLLVIAVARARGQFALVPHLSRQLTGAVLQVYNWVQLSGGSSYRALFANSPALASPVEHYWSLAIEEQYYLLWPVLLGALLVRARRQHGSVVRPIIALAVGGAVVAPIIAMVFGGDAAYWATPARLGEVLVGAAAAGWLAGGGVVPASASRLAPVALAGVVAVAVVLPSDAGPAYWGLLTPLALVTTVLLLSLQVPGRTRQLLSLSPLVRLGKVSYGAYLYHWPIFVLLRQEGWRLDRPLYFATAVALTLACAVASYLLLEQPIRRSGWTPRHTLALASSAVAASLFVIAVLPSSRGLLEPNQKVLDAAAIDTDAPPVKLVRTDLTAPSTVSSAVVSTDIVATSTTSPTVPTTTTTTALLGPLTVAAPPTPNRPVRILLVGDSTGFYVGQGLAEWAVDHPGDAQVDVLWCQGCGFILDGTITSFAGEEFVATSRDVVERQMAQRIERLHPDVVVLMTTVNDVANRQWDTSEGPLTPDDPRFRQRLLGAYQHVADAVVATGVTNIVWVIPPIPTSKWDTPEMSDPERYDVQHEAIREVATASGSVAVVADLDDWLNRTGRADNRDWRLDGTHLTEAAAKTLASEYLGPWLMRVALGDPLD
ncbi:MAG TPA: acyltransferase family protein [Ilumatobacteraceae bacterium]|nr:acyltransferase family protein [Ilumatobacteraceae bacterium]